MELTEDRTYRLGLKFLELGEVVKQHLDLSGVADSCLVELAQKCGDTALLFVRDGATHAVCIGQHHGGHVLQVTDRVRKRTPLYAGASPRTLLAFVPKRECEAVLDAIRLEPFTPWTVTDRAHLLKSLDRIRERGYAENDEELDLGVCAVAAPVRNHRGAVVAAVSIVGPKQRFVPPRRRQLIDWVVECTQEASAKLGHRGDEAPCP
jgi:DNA-binding IclR family transcriptional regulator